MLRESVFWHVLILAQKSGFVNRREGRLGLYFVRVNGLESSLVDLMPHKVNCENEPWLHENRLIQFILVESVNPSRKAKAVTGFWTRLCARILWWSVAFFCAKHQMLTHLRGSNRLTSIEKRKKAPCGTSFLFWSRWRDSNPRLLRPEQIRHRFLTTFVDFLMLFSPKTMLSDALVRTVST